MFHARTATRPHRATGATTTARALATVLAVGLLTSSVGTASAAPAAKSKTPAFTLTGTTVTPDGKTPVPRARVTVMPESTITFTDIDGDFLVAWSGRQGWITVVPEELGRDGKEWCKRVAIHGRPPESRDTMVDLGMITVMPKAQVGYQKVPTLPQAYRRPASMRAPGPGPGEPDTCRVQVSYATDIWGHITRVEITGGTQAPSGLKDQIFSWIRSIPWVVAAESSCDSSEPFKNLEWMDFAWADTAWVRISGLKTQDRPKPPVTTPQGR